MRKPNPDPRTKALLSQENANLLKDIRKANDEAQRARDDFVALERKFEPTIEHADNMEKAMMAEREKVTYYQGKADEARDVKTKAHGQIEELRKQVRKVEVLQSLLTEAEAGRSYAQGERDGVIAGLRMMKEVKADE
jgi:hypothetical protein